MNVHTEFDYEKFHNKLINVGWLSLIHHLWLWRNFIDTYLKNTYCLNEEEIEHVRKTYISIYQIKDAS